MSSTYNGVTVTNTATQIMVSNPGRFLFVIYNNGSNIIYIGLDNTVTSSTGIPILPQSNYTQNGDRIWQGSVWGITASSSSDTRYWDSSG